MKRCKTDKSEDLTIPSKELWTQDQLTLLQGLPPGPTVSLKRSEELRSDAVLPARIAGNLLLLCGVQNPTRGDGRTRCLAFPELTVTAVRRGAPSKVPDGLLVMGASATISTGTLSRYSPDILAAAVLTGANYLFVPIAQANADALRSPVFKDLSPRMRLGIAAGLSFQAFREQPHLFATAMQAAHIQDAKVNGNLRVWNLPKTSVPKDPRYPRLPTEFNMLDVFKSSSWNFDLGRLSLANVFTENCLSTARKPGATILSNSRHHVVPKVIAHPGEFVREFLDNASQQPPERERLAEPLRPDSSDYATLMAAWIANDISSGFLEDWGEMRTFRRANSQLGQRMGEVLMAVSPESETR